MCVFLSFFLYFIYLFLFFVFVNYVFIFRALSCITGTLRTSRLYWISTGLRVWSLGCTTWKRTPVFITFTVALLFQGRLLSSTSISFWKCGEKTTPQKRFKSHFVSLIFNISLCVVQKWRILFSFQCMETFYLKKNVCVEFVQLNWFSGIHMHGEMYRGAK